MDPDVDDLPDELELSGGSVSEFDVDDLPDELELGGETLDVGLQQVHLINTQYENLNFKLFFYFRYNINKKF